MDVLNQLGNRTFRTDAQHLACCWQLGQPAFVPGAAPSLSVGFIIGRSPAHEFDVRCVHIAAVLQALQTVAPSFAIP
jgi:hypothetical protein